MKNIEKYPSTEDALNAWLRTEAVKGGDGQPLDGWLCEEYAEPNPPSLLEAAKAARDWMSSCVVMGAEGAAARGNLTAAIKAEETRRAHEEGEARKLALSARDREAARTFGAEEK